MKVIVKDKDGNESEMLAHEDDGIRATKIENL
jgi:hypothetical protein